MKLQTATSADDEICKTTRRAAAFTAQKRKRQMAQQDNPYLTITLTGRPPVKIKKEEWPVVASASDSTNSKRTARRTGS